MAKIFKRKQNQKQLKEAKRNLVWSAKHKNDIIVCCVLLKLISPLNLVTVIIDIAITIYVTVSFNNSAFF